MLLYQQNDKGKLAGSKTNMAQMGINYGSTNIYIYVSIYKITLKMCLCAVRASYLCELIGPRFETALFRLLFCKGHNDKIGLE